MQGCKENSTRPEEFAHRNHKANDHSNEESRNDDANKLVENQNDFVKESKAEKIRKFRKDRNKKRENYKNLIVIKPSNKLIQALSLPKVLNINPRSIYNKHVEFVTFVKEEIVDLICMSESFEREDLPLEELIKIENFRVISNVHQRKGKGGRPAIIVNTQKYEVDNLTNTIISIPWGLEIV